MRCAAGGHDVGAEKYALHEHAVPVRVIEAGSAQPAVDRALGSGQQRAGPAGEIGYLQRLDGLVIRPIDLEPRHGEFGEKASGFRQRVERGEKLPIGNEGLKHPGREVMEGGRSDRQEFFGHLVGLVEERIRQASRDDFGGRPSQC